MASRPLCAWTPRSPSTTVPTIRRSCSTRRATPPLSSSAASTFGPCACGPGRSCRSPKCCSSITPARTSSREAPATGVDAAGRVVALWRQEDAGTSRPWSLWSSRFTPGQGWSTPGSLDDASASVGGYSLAVSSAGDAFAAWCLDPAGDLRARHFTAGAWAPSTASSATLRADRSRPPRARPRWASTAAATCGPSSRRLPRCSRTGSQPAAAGGGPRLSKAPASRGSPSPRAARPSSCWPPPTAAAFPRAASCAPAPSRELSAERPYTPRTRGRRREGSHRRKGRRDRTRPARSPPRLFARGKAPRGAGRSPRPRPREPRASGAQDGDQGPPARRRGRRAPRDQAPGRRLQARGRPGSRAGQGQGRGRPGEAARRERDRALEDQTQGRGGRDRERGRAAALSAEAQGRRLGARGRGGRPGGEGQDEGQRLRAAGRLGRPPWPR